MNAVTTLPARQPAQVQQQVLVPRTFEQLITFAEMAAGSGMVPRDFAGKPGAIMIAVQMGSELGLSPMQSITSIAVIGNRPGVFGDALLGLCRQSHLCQDIVETISGEDDARTAVCVATRRGATPTTARFSVADAKKAGLWGKSGPWSQYPDRMLQNRARGFALRDAFPDLLRGLKTVEELRDTPPDNFRGTTLDVASAPETVPQPIPKQPQVSVSVTAPEQSRRTWRTLLDDIAGMLAAAHTEDAVVAIADLPAVRRALDGPVAVQAEVKALLAAQFERARALADDDARAEAEEPEDDFPVAVALEPEATAPV